MHKRTAGSQGGFGRFEFRKFFQIAFLMALTAGFFADLCGLDPVVMAIHARGMARFGKPAIRGFAMAIRTTGIVLVDVRFMTEIQVIFGILFLTPRQHCNGHHACETCDQPFNGSVGFQYRTSIDPRPR